jgi:hypothetical protein
MAVAIQVFEFAELSVHCPILRRLQCVANLYKLHWQSLAAIAQYLLEANQTDT